MPSLYPQGRMSGQIRCESVDGSFYDPVVRAYPLAACYNLKVTLKEELQADQVRWAEVNAVIKEQRRSASLELRWRQLNAAIAMAKGLGLVRPDTVEAGVVERWAKLKEQAANRSQNPKA